MEDPSEGESKAERGSARPRFLHARAAVLCELRKLVVWEGQEGEGDSEYLYGSARAKVGKDFGHDGEF